MALPLEIHPSWPNAATTHNVGIYVDRAPYIRVLIGLSYPFILLRSNITPYVIPRLRFGSLKALAT